MTEIINLSRVAAIDCGTNSIRLLIADISGGKFKEVLRDMEIVRLGQGVDENKSFNPDAINRTLAAVEKFKNQLAGKGVEKIRFCATSATRDAANRDLFIDGVRQILGVEVEVIPGEEEARLSFNGTTKELLQSDAPFLVVDIGGGSTEFVYGNKEVEFAKSVDIGCVRMSERHLKSQPVEMSQVAQAIIDIDKAIAQAAAVVPIST
ncbi:MAG: Ppx/GppA phosphatase family protein, partial [Candidatus Nanopelagicaceae bacterium]